MEKVSVLLNMLKARAAVDAVVLTTGDGLVVDGIGEKDTDIEAIAAYAASYASVSARMAEESNVGPVDTVIVVYQGRAMVVAPVDSTVVVALVGRGGMQLGNMRLQLQRCLKDLAAALQEEAQDAFLPVDAKPDNSLTEYSTGAENGAENGAEAPIPQEVPVKLA